MFQIIELAYKDIENKFMLEFNSKDTRQKVKDELSNVFGKAFEIKCDEENNPPFIVDMGCLLARVSYKTDHDGIKYVNLVFGNERNKELVNKYYN